jgi:diguanylate cyclase (GGDEF)-like protein
MTHDLKSRIAFWVALLNPCYSYANEHLMSYTVIEFYGSLLGVRAQMINEFIELSQDGYGIYDQDDILIFCNSAFAELNYHPKEQLIGRSFEEIVRLNYSNGRGAKIDSKDVNAFLHYAHKMRRSRPFRIFEVDFMDGRWYLFSEQVNESRFLLVQMKEITKQKILQGGLENTLEKLSELALVDELTGCANRRGFVNSVENELKRNRHAGTYSTMALIDLDLFKKVNDEFGHQIGDAALQHVTKLATTQLRQYDIFGRVGGEEFAIFLRNTDQEIAFNIINRIREQIAATPLKINGHTVFLSISVGLVTEGSNASFEQLYTKSDFALYKAKALGRNQVQQY